MTPEDTQLAQVGAGIISGGWQYVIMVYGFTWTTLVGYTLSVVLRSRGVARRAAQEEAT